MMPIAVFYDYAMSMLGTPYKWGGSNPLEGIDCSGLVLELLEAVGVFPQKVDMTAAQIMAHFKDHYTVETPGFGTLAFFGNSAGVTHVGFCLNSTQMLEAGGGDHTCTTREIAAQKGAFVKVRPITHRKDLVGYCHPPYPWKA